MAPLHVETPLVPSLALSRASGRTIEVKMDALQPSGSFKLRGVGAVVQAACARGERRFVAASGGHAGLAVAHAARRVGAAATIVVPERASAVVRALIAAEGAEIVVHGDVWDDAHAEALRRVQATGGFYVHPFEGEELWRGHASLVHELAARRAPPEAIVVAVGGGGLLAGVAAGLADVGWRDTALVAVETSGAAGMTRALEAGRVVTLDVIDTIASSLASRSVSARVLEIARTFRLVPTLVDDAAALRAVRSFLADHRVLVEPACGAALAVAYDRSAALEPFQDVVVVACGGAGVSLELIEGWEARLRAR
jgi:L-serine/L-threonine ammonia-lyase